MALHTPAFCSATDLDEYMSSAGVISFADHDQSGASDTNVVDNCINRGHARILDFAGQQYEAADLATSETIKEWNIIIACYVLCGLRGNPRPDSLVEDYKEICGPGGLLSQVRAGLYKLYGLSVRSGKAPTFSNLRVDRRYPSRQIRVKSSSSNPQAIPSQDKVVEGGPYDY